MTQFTSLPNDIVLDILIFASPEYALELDLRTVMNFGMTCTQYWNLLNDEGDRLWISILTTRHNYSKKRFKSSTLSILEWNCKDDKCSKLLNIIKNQKRYETKHKIVKEANKFKYFSRWRYFENLKVEDTEVALLISKIKAQALTFSPENIIEKHFLSPTHFLSVAIQKLCFSLQDIIDSLFQKRNAHFELLELDIKEGIDHHSILYKEWKKTLETDSSNPNLQYIFPSLIRIFITRLEPKDVFLFLKFFYLECPNKIMFEELVYQTGFEQEKQKKGNFKKQLELLRTTYHNYFNAVEGINMFEKELYPTLETDSTEGFSIFEKILNTLGF